ncbi:MAG TPA: hypothetical protein VHU91_08660 [Mycobacteriales bacterium]|jgi:hypothetical protein|nr:hypothetical protein [Mycobacteriales bacterium]
MRFAQLSARVILVGLGLVGLGVGLYGLWDYYPADVLIKIGKWLVAGLILHDGILVPLVLGIGTLVWWATRRLPEAVGRIVTGGLIVGGVVSLLAAPAVWREGKSGNPTILTQHYGHNLAWLLLGVGAVTAGLAIAAWARGRSRPAASGTAVPAESVDRREQASADVRQEGEGRTP